MQESACAKLGFRAPMHCPLSPSLLCNKSCCEKEQLRSLKIPQIPAKSSYKQLLSHPVRPRPLPNQPFSLVPGNRFLMPGFIVVTPLVLLISDGRRWRANKSLFFFFLLSLFGEDGLIGATRINFTTLPRERSKIQESEASLTSMAWAKILQKLRNQKTFFPWKKSFDSNVLYEYGP